MIEKRKKWASNKRVFLSDSNNDNVGMNTQDSYTIVLFWQFSKWTYYFSTEGWLWNHKLKDCFISIFRSTCTSIYVWSCGSSCQMGWWDASIMQVYGYEKLSSQFPCVRSRPSQLAAGMQSEIIPPKLQNLPQCWESFQEASYVRM